MFCELLNNQFLRRPGRKTETRLLKKDRRKPVMRAAVRVMPSRRKHVRFTPAAQESSDVQELASEAADALEAYRRAPWRQLTERTRMAKLRRAIDLLRRIEDLETGRVSTPV